MGVLADIMASMVTSVEGAASSLLCAPFYAKMKASMDVLNAPESFSEDVKKLSNLMNDIKGLSSSSNIDEWISEAEKIMKKVTQSSSQNQRRQLSCCIHGHGAVSRCKIHKKVRKLMIQGQDIIGCASLKIEPVEPIHDVARIGNETTAKGNLRQVMDMLKDDEVWIIGVWGPGGVGKTTLVKALNNKLKSHSSFDLVIFIELTKDANKNEIQKAILKRLNRKVEDGMSTNWVANWIHNRLQREKFLIILDNVWESINLASIGIPENQKGSKIVLTTRRENVCMRMKAKVIKVAYLTTDEAWKLFAEKAGEVVNDPRIQPLAKDVCKECGDLPLALVAVGSAMQGKTNIHVWQNVRNELRRSAPILDIESEVYNSLKLSYDSLEDDTLKSCFLYCSLYPEGCRIEISELVQCWMAENIIGEELSYEEAYSKGVYLIENLKYSCLMEEAYEDKIKMHDVVRDVAIWIGKLNETSIIFSRYGISKSSNIALSEKEENTKWVSFVDDTKIELPEYERDFHKVTTLLIRTEMRKYICEEFLKRFQALRVMLLWGVQFSSYSVLHLTQLRALILRDCYSDLDELQFGAKLKVLVFSSCSICKLPSRVGQLTKLKVLVLQGTWFLRTIEVDVILNLSALEILDTRGSGYKWPIMRRLESKEIVLQDLSGLKSLREVYLGLADMEATYEECNWMEKLKNFQFSYAYYASICSAHSTKAILIGDFRGNKIGSFILHAEKLLFDNISGNTNKIFTNLDPKNQSNSKLKLLQIQYCSFPKELTGLAPESSSLSNLEVLRFGWNEQVRSLYQVADALVTTFSKLRRLYIFFCSDVENVFSSDYPHMVLPELEEIRIHGCMNITEVFHGSPAENQVVVPKLKRLVLANLESLRSLCSYESSEQWQSLEILEVYDCPNLKKLPNMTSIKEIRGDGEWWNKLKWDSTETKPQFNELIPLDALNDFFSTSVWF